MSFTIRAALLAAITTIAIAILNTTGFAHGFKVGDLEIGHPWTKVTPPSAKVAGGYLTVTNNGKTEDRLVSATFAGSASTELHEMIVENGFMSMRELPKGIVVKPGQKVELSSGGLHLMFMNLKEPLKEGDTLKGELVFEKAGRVEIGFKVEALGYKPKGSTAHHH